MSRHSLTFHFHLGAFYFDAVRGLPHVSCLLPFLSCPLPFFMDARSTEELSPNPILSQKPLLNCQLGTFLITLQFPRGSLFAFHWLAGSLYFPSCFLFNLLHSAAKACTETMFPSPHIIATCFICKARCTCSVHVLELSRRAAPSAKSRSRITLRHSRARLCAIASCYENSKQSAV